LENISFLEKRDLQRIESRHPVRFQFKDASLYGGCLSLDVSENGIGINMNKFVPVDTELDLLIQLEEKKKIECRGKVVWVEKFRFSDRYKIGLEFIGTGNLFDSKKEIRKLIKRM